MRSQVTDAVRRRRLAVMIQRLAAMGLIITATVTFADLISPILAFAVALAAAAVLAVLAPGLARWVVPAPKPVCPECGYPVKDLAEPRCPECGQDLPDDA